MAERHPGRSSSAELKRLLEDRTRALEETEARYKAIFDSTFTFTVLTTLDGCVLDANRSALAATRTSLESIRGRSAWELPVVSRHPAEAERLRRVFKQQRGQFVRYEMRLRFPDGVSRTIDFSIRPVAVGNGGRADCVVLEGRDVTDLRRAEERVLHAERMEALGKLTGGVAHDFNNLLTVVVGGLDIALRRPERPGRERLLQNALEAARRGEILTKQLLSFARRTPVRAADVDIAQALRCVEALLHNAVGEAIEIEIQAPATCGAVRMDPSQFETALLNLAVNARDAMPSGGRLIIKAQQATAAEVAAAGLPAGDYVCLVISDTGVGIPVEALPHVFEPFFTTKEVGEGTGLGLSQVYGFARQSGGAVDAANNPGGGATFKLLLPLTDAAPAAPETPEPQARPLSFRSVLLVEDDPAVSQVAEAMLTDLGLTVTLARKGSEAREIMRAEPFDLLITDVIMPGGLSGPDLARWAARERPTTKVLLCSGWTGEALSRQMRETPWPLIQKPFDTETLRRAIARLEDSPRPTETA